MRNITLPIILTYSIWETLDPLFLSVSINISYNLAYSIWETLPINLAYLSSLRSHIKIVAFLGHLVDIM